MRTHQQAKRNPITYTQHPISNKSNNSGHSLLSMKDYRKPTVSRQRQEDKNIKDRSQNKYDDRNQCYDQRALKTYSSRHVKDNSATKTQIPIKKKQSDQHLQQHSQQHSQHSYRHQDSNHSSNHNAHGISINVNIQNLITPKHVQQLQHYGLQKQDQAPLIEKNSIILNNNQPKKIPNKIVRAVTDIQCLQFECNQQLAFTKPKSVSPHNKQQIRSRQNIDPKNVCKSQKVMRAKQKPKIMTPEQTIAKFQSQIQKIDNQFNTEGLLYLDNRLVQYRINPNYIQQCQPNLTWRMRAQLVEWMMEISNQYYLKRQTFHIAVNLVDRYLQKQRNLQKSDFQLVGAAAMFIASKLQQFQPKPSQDFVTATGKSIKATKLKQMQKKMCITLQYKLNPPTLYRWANRLMLQWDNYVHYKQQMNQYPEQKRYKILFKFVSTQKQQQSQQSYLNYRLLIQLIDCSTLQIQTAIYHPKLIVCSFMYLFLGKQSEQFDIKQIYQQFPSSSQYLYDDNNIINQIFNQFLQFTFGIQLLDLLPTIQYCASFFILPPNVDAPAYNRLNINDQDDMEEYQSYQTFDRNMIAAVCKRRRDI